METDKHPAHQNFEVLAQNWVSGESFITFPIDHYLDQFKLEMDRPREKHNLVTRSALLTVLNLAAPRLDLPSFVRNKSKYNIRGEAAIHVSQREVFPSQLSASNFINRFTYFIELLDHIGIRSDLVARRSGISDNDFYGCKKYLQENRLSYEDKRSGFDNLTPGANYLNQLATKCIGGVGIVDNRMMQSGAALILTHMKPEKSESQVADYYNIYATNLLKDRNFQNEIGINRYRGYQPLTFGLLKYQQVTYVRARAKCLDRQGYPVPGFNYLEAGVKTNTEFGGCYGCELIKYCGLRIGNFLLEQSRPGYDSAHETKVKPLLNDLHNIATTGI
jgi:hypothetical protein